MDDVVLLGAFEFAFGNWQMRLEQDYGSSRVSRASARRERRGGRGGERGGLFVFLCCEEGLRALLGVTDRCC